MAEGTPLRDYTAFVPALADQRVVRQQDGPASGGFFPTSAWRTGDVVPHQFSFDLPSGVQGDQLVVILYDLTDGRHLATTSGPDLAPVGTIEEAGARLVFAPVPAR